MIFYTISWKNVSCPKEDIQAVFFYLKVVYNSFPRNSYWVKPSTSKLYDNFFTNQVSFVLPIPVQKRVKQGCLFANFLLNVYINSIIQTLENIEFHPAQLGNKCISFFI